MPRQVSLSSGRLTIDAGFSVHIADYTDRRLQAAVSRLAERVAQQTGIPLLHGDKTVLIVECSGGGPEYPSLSEDESYRLNITESSARLDAPTVTGALRGIETFLQLIAVDGQSFYVPAARVEDRPRFAWRGFMLDVARHWMPLE
ncbi:MAG TPA: glycoside hydrolase family 20 zincin-like fold domain-containing protein, partial [Bryobacteraceae bacterium]|nr:glycoside hydrolase family 20 zincin-like fold domain-containing protein [Bryobacteraceae bacterium]